MTYVSALAHWLQSDWTHVGAFVAGVLFAFSVTWGSIKAAYFKTTGKPMPRNWFTLTLDIGVELSNNLLGFINKILLARGKEPMFPPPSPPLATPPLPTTPTEQGTP